MIEIQDGRELATRNAGLPAKAAAPLTVGRLEQALLAQYPREDAESWDRTGILVGDPAALVTGVAVALDPTPAAVEVVRQAGANVLLTHHPAFIDPPQAFAPTYAIAEAPGVSVYAAASNGIALMNFHTALDASVQATRMFARIMSLDFQDLLQPLPGRPDKGYGIRCSVRAADAPMKLTHVAARATSVFGRAPRVWGDPDARVNSVVIANGSASAVVDDCVRAQVDCLVCGEIRYHAALNAAQTGLTIVELGHDVSEFPLCALLAQAAAEAGVPQESITMVDQTANWSYPEATRV